MMSVRSFMEKAPYLEAFKNVQSKEKGHSVSEV